MSGTDGERERGVELLQRAMEMREEQLRKQIGSREWLSQARESYARGLLAVKRAEEAIVLLDLALRVHQEEFGHGTWRTRTILMQKFSALLELGLAERAEVVEQRVLALDIEKEDWERFCDDALWLADGYSEAGALRHANGVLRTVRTLALQHGRVDSVQRFDHALQVLADQ